MNINYITKIVGRVCVVIILFALALWVMLWIGHEKEVQCSIVSGEIKKTVTKEGGKSTTCRTPHLVVQYIANKLSYTAPAPDSPISMPGECLSPEQSQSLAANYPVNSFQKCFYDPETPMNVHFHKTTYKPLADFCLKIAFFCFVILIVINMARRRKSPNA